MSQTQIEQAVLRVVTEEAPVQADQVVAKLLSQSDVPVRYSKQTILSLLDRHMLALTLDMRLQLAR